MIVVVSFGLLVLDTRISGVYLVFHVVMAVDLADSWSMFKAFGLGIIIQLLNVKLPD